MFYRRKKEGYGQVIETYRDGGKVKQRVILYVGHYATVDDALSRMPRDVAGLRRRATEQEKRAQTTVIHSSASEEVQEADRKRREEADRKAATARARAEGLSGRLEELRSLVTTNPDLRSDQ